MEGLAYGIRDAHRRLSPLRISFTIATAFLPSCSAEGHTSSGYAATDDQVAESLGAAPAALRELTIATAAYAACNVTHGGQSMPVTADGTGIVHLWATTTVARDVYSVDCAESGSTVHHEIDLAEAATFAPVVTRSLPPAARVLPPINDDPMRLTQAQLRNAGYPPRPDPDRAAPLYEKWLEAVSKPITFIPGHPVPRPDLSFDPFDGPIDDPRKSGLVAAAVPGVRYAMAVGVGNVPLVSPTGSQSNVAFWVGVGNSPLIQDGLYFFFLGGLGAATVFYEYWPNDPQGDSAVPFRPNDTMRFWAWEGDASCNAGPGLTGNGCFYYENLTQGYASAGVQPQPPGGGIDGVNAAAMVERQANTTLASWTNAQMEFAILDSNGAIRNVTSEAYYNFTMKVSNVVLATTTKVGSDIASFKKAP